MSSYPFFKDPKHSDSLIVDLEGETEPLGVTMGLNLGTVINRLDKEFICIGSGEILAGIKTFKLEEIRAYIVRRGDLDTVRTILKKWIKQKSSLEPKKEVVLKGILGSKVKNSPIVYNENNDTIFSIMSDNKEIKVRFIKKNLRFVIDIDLTKKEALRKTKVYTHGLALFIEPDTWEIQGRALITL